MKRSGMMLTHGSHVRRRPAAAMLLLTLLTATPALHAQTPAQTPDTARAPRWYDTLEVTKPRFARATNLEKVALAGFTALAIPVSVVVGLTTVVPPSVNFLVEDGVPRAAVAFSVGRGFGGDTSQVAFFPAFRAQLEYGYYFTRSPRNRVALSLVKDWPLESIHERDFFWLGVAGGAGIATDFGAYQPFLEGWIGILNPMGLRYITLFPMHNYGLRVRGGYDVTHEKPWYEVSIAATSTFW